jgi:adenine-specific DNA-methyltransferase
MATGVPRGFRSKSNLVPRKVELSYPGKRSIDEILKTPPGVFEVISTEPEARNQLYFADNLPALAQLAAQERFLGQVKLVYIDPPYGTQTVFHSRKLAHAYEDVFDLAEYLEFLRARLAFLHHLLSEDGSIYVHIDEKMLFHVKLVLDEIFGPENYRNCITRKKCNPKNYTRKTYGNVADYILFYTKSDEYVWNRQVEAWTDERAKEYQYIEQETGRRYMKVPVHAPGTRNGETGKPWRGMLPPPGKHWQFTPSMLDELDRKGEIFWSKHGNPRRKVYLDENPGISVQDIWMEFRDAHNQNIHVTGYPTEKNIDLVKRIILASSNPGDLVLDCFAGSGTTLVAADMLGRRFVGMDNSKESLRTILHRFALGTAPMGDFVERANPDPRKPTNLSLFEREETADTHEVKNYSLAVEVEKLADGMDLLRQAPPPQNQPRWKTPMALPKPNTVPTNGELPAS